MNTSLPPMAPTLSSARNSAKPYSLAIKLSAGGLIVILVGAAVGFCFQHSQGFAVELAKAALTLGSGLILGGALKVLLDSYQAEQKKQDEARELRERLLADLRSVYDQTERARLMINAQRSAHVYSEQMQILISCQAVLLKFKRSLELRWHCIKHVDPKHLRQIIGYLRALQNEYANNYKPVEDYQYYDNEIVHDHLRELAAAHAPFDRNTVRNDHPAWDLLRQPKDFPILCDLTECGTQYTRTQYTTMFAEPLHKLAAQLLETTDSCQPFD